MTGPKRTPEQRELDLARMVKLLRRGLSKTQIAEQLGVSRGQIVYDWKQVLARLQADRDKDAKATVAAKLEEYREVKAEAWAAWERSKEDKERRTAETVTETSGGGEPPGQSRTKAVKQIEGRLPDHDYLNTVLKCLEAERELEGLDPPKKLRLGGEDGGPIQVTVVEVLKPPEPAPNADRSDGADA